MTDYYSILSRAVASLDPSTAQSRAALFNRARQMMRDRIRDDHARWTEAEIRAEIDYFEAAIARIESESARWSDPAPPDRRQRLPLDEPQPRRGGRTGLWSLLGVAALLLVCGVAYVMLSGRPASVMPDAGAAKTAAKTTAKTTTKTIAQETPGPRTAGLTIDENEVPPGIDGGSTDTGLPYFFRRQAVYYRTTYSAGMIVVDRSQRFLYLVQPQARALRYGIGVGGECSPNTGLYRITRKVEWPEWSPSPDLLKRRSYPARVPGGPGNPLGARALYFESIIGLHGTNAPKSIGQALTLGCIRLINDDIVDLDKRVAIGAGVVVTN